MPGKIRSFFLWNKLGKQLSDLHDESQKEVKNMEGEIKPGYKTTEFWGKSLVQIIAVGSTILQLTGNQTITPEQQQVAVTTGLAVIAGIEIVYNGARSLVKFIAELRKPKIVVPPVIQKEEVK